MMLATEFGERWFRVSPWFQRCVAAKNKWHDQVGHNVRFSGLGKYAFVVATLLFSANFLPLGNATSSHIEFFGYLTLIAIAATFLIGLGPGVVATAGMFLATIAWVDWDSAAVYQSHDTGFLFCALIFSNAVALRSTFWRVRAERQVAYSNRLSTQLKLLTDGAVHYALYMTDTTGRIAHWNLGAERFTGWISDEVMGNHITMLYADDPAMVENLIQAFTIAREQGSCEFDLEFRKKDDTTFLQNCVVTALYDANGELHGFAKLVRDVTFQRGHELALEQREAELRCILETAPEAVFVVDDSGAINYINAAASQMFGYAASALHSRPFHTMLIASKLTDSTSPTGSAKTLSHFDTSPVKLIARRRNGSHFPIEMSFARSVREHAAQTTIFVRDLTDEQATKARLEALQTEMLHGTRQSAMGAMASMMAHELNQPLTAIAAYMEGSAILLKRGDAIDRQKLDRVFKSTAAEAVRAGAIMHRLRNFGSHGDALLEVHGIEDIVSSSIALIRSVAETAAVTIRVDLAPDAGPVFADPIQIQQVLGNLCRNAVDSMRDSPNRILTISAFAVSALETQFKIMDTGPGIPEPLHEKIFDAFVTSKKMGTGVGLSICRTIVEAHGGKIWVDSSQPGGCLSFTLRRKKENALGNS